MPTMAAEPAAGDLGMKRFENQLKIQQLETDALRMRLFDTDSSNDRRRRTLEEGTDEMSGILRMSGLESNTHVQF